MLNVLPREVRAVFTDKTITVYQAYSAPIADAACRAGTFVAPFKRGRMTWIKPSFLWMMYRSGWATKPGQERVLAVEITREGFEWALAHSCLSHYEPHTFTSEAEWDQRKHASPVRVQWDPERSLTLAPLENRAIQIGLSGEAVDRYIDGWIVAIADITTTAHAVAQLVDEGDLEHARLQLPAEAPYPLRADLAAKIGATRLRGT